MAFHQDFETKSELSLPDVGLDNYLKHPSTSVLMLAYATDNDQPKLWEPHKQSEIPAEVMDNILSPFQHKYAWNSGFERGVYKHVLGIDIPLGEWRDPMITSRSLSIGSQLSAASKILGLGEDEAKMAEGTRLKNLFCMPQTLGGKETLFGISKATFRDWRTDKIDWDLFGEYCKMDVRAEQAIDRKMFRFPLPDQEWDNWVLDQVINERGITVNMDLVNGASFIAAKEVEILTARLKELTKLENPNSRDQLIAWAQAQGYPFSSLGKAFVGRAMAGEGHLTDLCKEVLEIRKMTSKSSVSKYSRIADMVSSDGRLRYQFAFMGAGRTGRWSGKGSEGSGVQLQNLSRPTKAVAKRMDLAIELVQKMDYEAIKREFGQPLEVVTSVIRSSFQAPDGYKLIVADLSAIENVILGWLSGCDSILKVFREGRDPYIDFAVDMYKQPYEVLYAEWQAGDSTKRTNSKAPVLGCGFGLAGGEESVDEEGDRVFSGLMGYSRALGIELTKEQADQSVKVFRKKFPEVVKFWYAMEEAAISSVRNPGTEIAVERPNKSLITFRTIGKSMLKMRLPSGRDLHYVRPEVHEQQFTSKKNGAPYTKACLSFEGKEQGSHVWGRVSSFGSHLVENGTQASARDLLVNGMQLAHKKGFSIVAHIHDEIVCLEPEDTPLTLADLCACLTSPPAWADTDLPLGAAGYENKFFKKE